MAEIKALFQPWEIAEYLDNAKRIGALGHVCTDEQSEQYRDKGDVEADPVKSAADILLLERARDLLLEES